MTAVRLPDNGPTHVNTTLVTPPAGRPPVHGCTPGILLSIGNTTRPSGGTTVRTSPVYVMTGDAPLRGPSRYTSPRVMGCDTLVLIRWHSVVAFIPPVMYSTRTPFALMGCPE